MGYTRMFFAPLVPTLTSLRSSLGQQSTTQQFGYSTVHTLREANPNRSTLEAVPSLR